MNRLMPFYKNLPKIVIVRTGSKLRFGQLAVPKHSSHYFLIWLDLFLQEAGRKSLHGFQGFDLQKFPGDMLHGWLRLKFQDI